MLMSTVIIKEMKKIVFFLMLVSLPLSQCKSQVSFIGNWSWSSSTAEYSITLNQAADSVYGNHCAIVQSGQKMDCAEQNVTSIRGVISSDTARVVFTSAFSNAQGTAIITKSSDTTLVWKIITLPSGEFYIPREVTLTKVSK